MKSISISILFLSLIILSSCSKEKSKQWLIADIEAFDSATGKHVPAKIYIHYVSNKLMGDIVHEGYIASTYENGHILVEHELAKKAQNITLEVHPYGGMYGIPPYGTYQKIAVSAKSKNEATLLFDPLYPYSLELHNTNCSGPADTLWLILTKSSLQSPVSIDTMIYTGCIDTTIAWQYGYAGISWDPNLGIDYILKQNGVTTTNSYTQTLTPAELTPVVINY